MAVQLENGYTKIAHELLEVIPFYKFNGTQFSILIVIIRLTYGFNRKDYGISLKSFIDKTGIKKSQIDRELDALILNKVVIVAKKAVKRNARKLGINKKYDEWTIKKRSPLIRVLSSNQGTVPEIGYTQSSNQGTETVPEKEYPIKDIIIKDNLKETIYTIFEFWNTKKITVHKELTDTTKTVVNARLQFHSEADLLEAISNYHACLMGEEYYYSHKFTLKEFMNPKNVDKFLTANDPFGNFKIKFKKKQDQENIYNLGKELEDEMNGR